MTAVLGLCVRHPYDPALWDFDVPGESAKQQRRRHAMATEVCGRCPIAGGCESAARPGREEGVWGGRLLPELTVPKSHKKKPVAA